MKNLTNLSLLTLDDNRANDITPLVENRGSYLRATEIREVKITLMF